MKNRGAVVVGLLSCCIAAVGCGAGGETGSSSGSGAANGTGGAGASGAGVGGNLTTVGSGGGQGTFRGCSEDLQSVLDEAGNVLETCPPELGCYEGECIAACEAAASSKSSIGCEYNAATAPFVQNEIGGAAIDGTCFAMFIANTWGRPALFDVTYDGQQLDAATFARIPSGVGASTQYAPLPATGLPPGQVAVLFLSHRPGVTHSIGGSMECPVTPAVLLDTAPHGSARGKAFSVVSDTPVTAYDILPFGGANSFLPSASLLYPRTAWGTNYLTISPNTSTGGIGRNWVTLVGLENDTSVSIVPPVTLPGGTNVPMATANMVTTLTLGAGETVQYMGADPTGAILDADKPIGVYTGDTYLGVSTTTSPSGGGRDSTHQQVLHVGALGNSYVGGGVVTRMASLAPESVRYRLIGAVDDTQLTWDTAAPAGAPTTLAAGQAVEFESTAIFHVSSQDEDHPFSLSQYLAGGVDMNRSGCGPSPPVGGINCGLGDEDWVVLVPPQQFLRRYAFFTDPTYATTTLVITRVSGPNGFADVEVECLGTVTGWQPVSQNGAYEVAHVDLLRAFTGATAECATSQHLATSDLPFGVMVWGTDFFASYGYPAGGNASTINEVIIPPDPPN